MKIHIGEMGRRRRAEREGSLICVTSIAWWYSIIYSCLSFLHLFLPFLQPFRSFLPYLFALTCILCSYFISNFIFHILPCFRSFFPSFFFNFPFPYFSFHSLLSSSFHCFTFYLLQFYKPADFTHAAVSHQVHHTTLYVFHDTASCVKATGRTVRRTTDIIANTGVISLHDIYNIILCVYRPLF